MGLDHAGRTRVHAADDAAARTPLFSCACASALPEAVACEGPVVETGVVHGAGGVDGFPFTAPGLREGVMIGAPYEGGEPAFLTTGPDGTPVVTPTTGPVRMPRPVAA
ncbi:hypothetical protein [Streptomyces litmocidini]|uniref:hypothetical protein n=1 Tax=Streptomyces litmocidini TaxID=67318 RepID=UPI0037009281